MNRQIVSSAWLLGVTLILVIALIPFDPRLSESAQSLPDSVVAFNQRITDFGTFSWMIYGSGVIVIIAYLIYRVSRNKTVAGRARTAWRLALYFFATIGIASIIVHLLKFLIGRARPEMLLELGPYSLTPFAGDILFESFPSGHSTAVGAFFGAFALLVPRLRYVFVAGALLIGVSRVIVGAHYPSDVAAGLLLGLWTAITLAFLFARRTWLFAFNEHGWPTPKQVKRPPPKM